MTTVWVVNRGCHDYSDAEKFGGLRYLSESSMNRFDVSAIWRKFEPQLRHSESGDYILTSGLTVMSVVATSVFVHLHGRLNLLMFKGRRGSRGGEYIPETIILGEKNGTAIQDPIPAGTRNAIRSAVAGNKGRRKKE